MIAVAAGTVLVLLAAAGRELAAACAPLARCPHCCAWVSRVPSAGAPAPVGAGRERTKAAEEGADAARAGGGAEPGWAERERELVARYESRIVELERLLREERERALRRENEWLEFSMLVSTLELSPETLGPEEPVAEEAAAPAPPDPAARLRQETLRKLKALVRVERVTSLEPLEVGEVHDGWAGPVVFRTLDEGGRPSGTLVAERLHLEGSIAARTLTLCFEAGYERLGGERVPFDGAGAAEPLGPVTSSPDGLPVRRGERRIVLSLVDPRPWMEVLPHLFPPGERDATVPDDGLRARGFLRLSINRLLDARPESRGLRLVALGGVTAVTLHDVQLEVAEREGGTRRVFADRLRVCEEDRGLSLRFEDGAVQRGERRAPFLDGRYRIFLPSADVAAWRAAEIPLATRE